MNNNGFKNGAFLGSVLGVSLGMIFGTRMNSMQKRRIMRTAKRAKSNLINGMNSLWR